MSKEYTLSSVKEILELVEKFGMSADFVYRGQKSSHEHLTTSLERHIDNPTDLKYRPEGFGGGVEYNNLHYVEHEIIKKFQQGAQHYCKAPDKLDYIQWLALMQHHGAPTRLLDVTRSLFVALYFAVLHDDDVDGVIYSFFALEWFYRYDSLEPTFTKANQFLKPSFEISPKQPAPIKDLPLRVINVKPLQLNRRQIAQQGEFLMPSRIDHSFEENLSTTFGSYKLGSGELDVEYSDYKMPNPKNPIVKFIIPRKSFSEIRLVLTHMNITGAALFPDLDGFSKSMHEIAKKWKVS